MTEISTKNCQCFINLLLRTYTLSSCLTGQSSMANRPVFTGPGFQCYSTLRRLTKTKLLQIAMAVIFTGWMSFLSPNQQHQNTRGIWLKLVAE